MGHRETQAAVNTVKRWVANTRKVDRRLCRGSLDRMVRRFSHQPRW